MVRGIRFYTRIHDLGPEEINQILQHCNLTKWRIHPEENPLISKWVIQFCTSGTLCSINNEQFVACARTAQARFPVLWNAMHDLIEDFKENDGYAQRSEDNFRQIPGQFMHARTTLMKNKSLSRHLSTWLRKECSSTKISLQQPMPKVKNLYAK